MFLQQHVSVAEALDYTYHSARGLHEKHAAHMQQHASAKAVRVAEQAGIKAWKTDTDRRLHSLKQGSQASDKPLHPHGQLHKHTDSEDCLFFSLMKNRKSSLQSFWIPRRVGTFYRMVWKLFWSRATLQVQICARHCRRRYRRTWRGPA